MQKSTDAQIESLPGQEKMKLITARFILTVLLFLVTLTAFVAIADEIVLKHDDAFDQEISKNVSSFVSPATTQFMEFITFFGSANFLISAYVVLIMFYVITKRSKLALDVAMIGVSSTGILFLFKDIVKRHRPLDPLINHVSGFSFPSGHSFSSFTFYGLLIYLIIKTTLPFPWKAIISLILFSFATTIAISRVYLRLHFPSDVAAGFCLSVVWMMTALWVLHKADRGLVKQAKKDINTH